MPLAIDQPARVQSLCLLGSLARGSGAPDYPWALVMHRRGDRAVLFKAGKHLARQIPGAVWLPLDGVDHFWFCGDGALAILAIEAFVTR